MSQGLVVCFQSSSLAARESTDSSDDESGGSYNQFARDSSRRSLNSQNALKWAAAQEKQEEEEEARQAALEVNTTHTHHIEQVPASNNILFSVYKLGCNIISCSDYTKLF